MERQDAPIKSTETSLKIIEELRSKDEAQVSTLADDLDIAISTAHRHLQTLRKYGYVVKKGNCYTLGFQFLTVGGKLRDDYFASKIIYNKVKKLADTTKERVQFVIEEQGTRVFLYTASGSNAVEAEDTVGKRGLLHCSAAGKAILSELPDSRVQEILDQHGLPRITENTITDQEKLFEELEQIRETGVAFNFEESTQGLNAAGCPVKTEQGVIGALSVSGPSYRLKSDRLKVEVAETTQSLAQELELNIRYQ